MVQSNVPGAFISRLLSCGVEVVRARLISNEKDGGRKRGEVKRARARSHLAPPLLPW